MFVHPRVGEKVVNAFEAVHEVVEDLRSSCAEEQQPITSKPSDI